MKIKLAPALRFLIAAAIFATYILCMVYNVFDGIIRAWPVFMYIIAAVAGVLISGVTYGVLPTKKTIDTTSTVFKSDGKKSRTIGYWSWIGCGIIFCVIWVPFYISEM